MSISVANASRSYGSANPIFTGTISGLIGQDTVTVTYATTATTSSPTGAYPITATVGGPDAATYAATVTPGTLTINKTTSTLTLTAGPNPALAQSSVSLTAQATSSTAGVPTGTVTFSDGGTVLGTAPLDAAGKANYGLRTFPSPRTASRRHIAEIRTSRPVLRARLPKPSATVR